MKSLMGRRELSLTVCREVFEYRRTVQSSDNNDDAAGRFYRDDADAEAR